LERIRDFVAALRSGEYEQTSDQLAIEQNGERAYCCEGVAVERYGAQLGHTVEWQDGNLTISGLHDYAGNGFWKQLGLNGRVGTDIMTSFAFVLPAGLTMCDSEESSAGYMTLNDDGLTFSQIADLIEWQFLS